MQPKPHRFLADPPSGTGLLPIQRNPTCFADWHRPGFPPPLSTPPRRGLRQVRPTFSTPAIEIGRKLPQTSRFAVRNGQCRLPRKHTLSSPCGSSLNRRFQLMKHLRGDLPEPKALVRGPSAPFHRPPSSSGKVWLPKLIKIQLTLAIAPFRRKVWTPRFAELRFAKATALFQRREKMPRLVEIQPASTTALFRKRVWWSKLVENQLALAAAPFRRKDWLAKFAENPVCSRIPTLSEKKDLVAKVHRSPTRSFLQSLPRKGLKIEARWTPTPFGSRVSQRKELIIPVCGKPTYPGHRPFPRKRLMFQVCWNPTRRGDRPFPKKELVAGVCEKSDRFDCLPIPKNGLATETRRFPARSESHPLPKKKLAPEAHRKPGHFLPRPFRRSRRSAFPDWTEQPVAEVNKQSPQLLPSTPENSACKPGSPKKAGPPLPFTGQASSPTWFVPASEEAVPNRVGSPAPTITGVHPSGFRRSWNSDFPQSGVGHSFLPALPKKSLDRRNGRHRRRLRKVPPKITNFYDLQADRAGWQFASSWILDDHPGLSESPKKSGSSSIIDLRPMFFRNLATLPKKSFGASFSHRPLRFRLQHHNGMENDASTPDWRSILASCPFPLPFAKWSRLTTEVDCRSRSLKNAGKWFKARLDHQLASER